VGYDVTFHPVSAVELQRFVFDLVDKPALAAARAAEISKVAKKRAELIDIFGHLSEFAADAAKDRDAFGNTIAFAAAAVAGFLHPYWYARGSALTFLCIAKLAKPSEVPFMPLPRCAKGKVAKLKDGSGGFLTDNYTASGFLPPEAIAGVEALLDRLLAKRAKKLAEVFDDDGLDAVRRALRYAREHGLGMIEATDAIVPFSDEAVTDLDNARAHFLDNVAYDQPGKPKKKAKAKPAAKAKKKKTR